MAFLDVFRRGGRRAALAAACAVVLLALFLAWPRRMVYTPSALTGKSYYVKNDANKESAADRLALLERRVRRFLHLAKLRAPGDPRLRNILRRWNGTLAETLDDREVAYCLGKDAISMCLRDESGTLESENTAMYVLMHELAHIATDEYGHTPEFWDNMQFLLDMAEATGTYTRHDFARQEVSYCGRRLSHGRAKK